jgi:hypothetical protein
MIIKNADNKDSAITTLERLLVGADSKKQRLVSDELRMLHAGIKGENESAYHIDFNFKKSEITAVIHDLRLEIGGRVAQIDHLLIHRTHRFYVLETKNFSHGLKINDHGEFLRWNDWKKCYEGMPSPIEQNRRHAAVLGEVLERLGYKDPTIESFVLISPNARIDRPAGKDFSEVVKADQFLGALKNNLSTALGSIGGLFGAVSKLAFGDAADEIAKKLVRLHRPITIDYVGKFGMREEAASFAESSRPSAPQTSDNHRPISIDFGNTLAAPVPRPEVKKAATSGYVCKSCGSDNLAVEYGKFGYYFKCGACGANTSFKIGCGVAGHKEKIRKDKLSFYRECDQCGTSSIFFLRIRVDPVKVGTAEQNTKREDSHNNCRSSTGGMVGASDNSNI